MGGSLMQVGDFLGVRIGLMAVLGSSTLTPKGPLFV